MTDECMGTIEQPGLPLQTAIAQLRCHTCPVKFSEVLNRMQLSYLGYTNTEITIARGFWFRERNTEFCSLLKTSAALICKILGMFV